MENGLLRPDGILQLRGGTYEALTTENPLLARREIVVEVDTGKHKVGNGIDRWNSLSYSVGGSGGSGDFTETELRRLGILLDALFSNDTDSIYIPVINNTDPENPILLPYTPFQNLPKGSPPDWVQRDFPTSYSAYSRVHKMFYGSYYYKYKTTTGYIENALALPILKGSSLKSVNMQSLTACSDTNYPYQPTSNDKYLDFLLVNKDNATALYYTYGAGVLCSIAVTSGSSVTATNFTVVTSSLLSNCNSLCYSENLDIMLAVGATGNAVVMSYGSSTQVFQNTASTTYTIGVPVNPSSAAWSPDQLVFCVAGSEGTATSSDGVTWTTHTGDDVPKNLIDLSFRNDLGCFFARCLEDKLFLCFGRWRNLAETK